MTEPIEPHSSSSSWSWQGKAWLAFWIVLIVATPCLLYFLPEWFVWGNHGGGGRRKRLPTLEELPAILLFLVWLGGVGAWVMWFRNKRRSEGLATVAQELKLELTPAPTEEDWAVMGVFKFFQIGFQREARNWMTGPDLAILDYHFRRSALPRDVEINMSSRKYHQTVIAFWNVSARLPEFQLVTRDSWWRNPGKNRTPKECFEDLKIGQAMNDDFLKHYKVGGANVAALSEFFAPLLMEYFCAHKGWDVESTGGHLLVYQEKRLQPRGKMGAFVEQAREIATALRDRANTFRK